MRLRSNKIQAGFTIVELMVSITIGLLILAGLVAIFVNNSRARDEIDRANRKTENGRYAMEVISEDLRNAGYLARLDPSTLTTPTAMPDPCATAVADVVAALPVYVQGKDGNPNTATGPATLGCLSDVKAGSDILVIRRTATCIKDSTNCDSPTDAPYLQVSLCSNSTVDTTPYKLIYGASGLTLHKKNCTDTAEIYRYFTHIYFIANNLNAGDGIPTLKRADLGAGEFTTVSLVEGIDNMQLEYGLGGAYTTDPGTPENWLTVTTVKMHLLARNSEKTAGYKDTKTYTLAGKNIGPLNDAFKRHVFQTTVNVNNPAGRIATE